MPSTSTDGPHRELTDSDKLTRDTILDDVMQDVEFDFEVPDARNLLQSFVKREVLKSALKHQYDRLAQIPGFLSKRKDSVKRSSGLMKDALKAKTKKLQQKVQAPPFIRLSDKITFTASVTFLFVTECITLLYPQYLKYWYSFWIFPLMAWRYIDYHHSKFHYFMLDFCYFVQVLLLLQTFVFPDNKSLFQVLFALSNGPLAVAIPLWRNSLVFHDVDKITSVFIHFFPPLVTFCMRWFPPDGDMSRVCLDEHCTMPLYHAFVLTSATYIIWQVMYLIKTEYVDKQKLSADKKYMYSVRWLAEVKPHPVYQAVINKGFKPHPVAFLVVAQYTVQLLSVLPVLLVFHSFTLHCLWLSLLFIWCVWNGANYYFDVFSETYTKRLKRFISDEIGSNSSPPSTPTAGPAAPHSTTASATAAAPVEDGPHDGHAAEQQQQQQPAVVGSGGGGAKQHSLRTVSSAPDFGELESSSSDEYDSAVEASPAHPAGAALNAAARRRTAKKVFFYDVDSSERGVEAE